MIDNLAPQEQDQMNTVFLEERAIHDESTVRGAPTGLVAEVRSRMTDTDWMASQQILKPVLISQLEWSVTDSPGTILKKFEYPECLTSVESLVTRTLRIYAFFKISPVFRFQLNGTKFHQGQLICSWDPFAQAIDEPEIGRNTPVCNRFYATGLPNIKIMASESDPAELQIPFIHPRDYLTTNSKQGFDILGQIRVQVLNQLRAATGSSQKLTLSVWIYGRSAEVHVPMHDHELRIPDFYMAPPAPTSITSTGLLDVLGVLPQVVSKGTNIIGNVVTGNFGAALRTGQGLIDDLGEAFGFDYPARPLAPEKNLSPVENLAICKGASRSQRLAVDPQSLHAVSPALWGSPEQDMDAMKIAKTPMLLEQYEWKSTAAPGTQLMKIAVTPMSVKKDSVTIGDDTLTAWYPTYLSYISSYFCYWSGGITFDFEVVATGFHSGKLIAAFVPNNPQQDPTYQDISSALPAITLDIQQTSKFSFTVPYVSPTAMKSTRAPSSSDESMIGYMYVYVMNRLVNPSNVATSIDVNVYIRAADDFALYVPRPPRLREMPQKPPAITSTSGAIELQEERSSDSQKDTPAVLALGQKKAVAPQRFGEAYSMIDLIRRFCWQPYQGEDLFPATKEGQLKAIYVSPIMWCNPDEIDKQECYSFLDHLSKIYAAWAGSIRYKFVCPAPRTAFTKIHVVHEPDSLWTDSLPFTDSFGRMIDGYGHTLTTASQDNCLEVEVPFYSLWNMLLTMPAAVNPPKQSYLNPINNGQLFVNMVYRDSYQEGKAFLPLEVYRAAGEDFRFFYLRAPPTSYGTDQDFWPPA